MGDRVFFIVHNRTPDEEHPTYSPVIYGHHSGAEAPSLISALHDLMAHRRGDVNYSAARLVGIMHERIGGYLSLGMWNLPEDFRHETEYLFDLFGDEDAGLVLYNAETGEVECIGGYLTPEKFFHGPYEKAALRAAGAT